MTTSPMTPNERRSYDGGRRGESLRTHAGIAERDAHQQGARARPKPQDFKAPAGGGWILLLLLAAPIVLGVSAGAAAAAIVGGALLAGVLRLLGPRERVGYWRAFRTSFFSGAVFIALFAGIGIGARFLADGGTPRTFLSWLAETTNALALGTVELIVGGPGYNSRGFAAFYEQLTAARPDSGMLLALAGTALYLPALLAAAKVLEVRERWALGSRAEFLRAVLLTTLIVVPSLAIALRAFTEILYSLAA
jgi:hypothetical protein